MFNTCISKYSFDKLAEVYFRMLTNLQLDLFRWESEDADVFKSVQRSLPPTQTWLKEFFCAMGILLLDLEEYDIEGLDERDNLLSGFEINQTNYPDLEEGVQSIPEKDLEVFGISQRVLEQLEERQDVFLAFLRQMEAILERREEDFIIESELDPEKVSDFTDSYVSGFEEQFMFRQILKDLGWLEVQQYDGETEGFGYNVRYPKTAFISDPPVGLFTISIGERRIMPIPFWIGG
ncbi:hypothetical protein BRD01_14215 [Halobacteriales archaeon QS_8_65_32]|nr:MAG: hypothetical protein BRD01_14215 [Halobacteriales archaeon QS_8_65_32]